MAYRGITDDLSDLTCLSAGRGRGTFRLTEGAFEPAPDDARSDLQRGLVRADGALWALAKGLRSFPSSVITYIIRRNADGNESSPITLSRAATARFRGLAGRTTAAGAEFYASEGAAGAASSLWRATFDRSTRGAAPAPVQVGADGVLAGEVSALALLGDTLYGARLAGGSSSLVSIDTTTGAPTLIGAAGAMGAREYTDLAAVGAVLYGLSGDSLYAINTATGVPTKLDVRYVIRREWSNRPADALYWFLTERLGWPLSVIDLPAIAAARAANAQTMDVVLPGGRAYAAYPRRYARGQADGVVKVGDQATRVLEELAFAMAGEILVIGGRVHVRAGPAGTDKPIKAAYVGAPITADDVASYGAFRSGPALQSKTNAVTMSLNQSSEHEWGEHRLPLYRDTAAIERDRYQYDHDLGERLFVSEPVRALMLAVVHLRRARAPQTWELTLLPGAGNRNLALQPGDRVLLDLPDYYVSMVPAEVQQTASPGDDTITVTFQASPAGIYDDTLVLPSALTPFAPVAGPGALDALTTLAAAGGAYLTAATPAQPYIDVSWTPTGPAVEIEITGPGGYASAPVVVDASPARISVPYPGAYVVTARQHDPTGLGADGPDSTAAVTVTFDAAALIPAVPNLAAVGEVALDESRQNLTRAVRVTWDASGFDVRVRLSGPGAFFSEQVVDTGENGATFIVPELGEYTARAALRHRPSGLEGAVSEATAQVATAVLRPGLPAVQASATAEIADDGTIRSTVTIGWTETADRTRVRVTGPEGYEETKEALASPLTFDVPNAGAYAYEARHYNVAEVGAAASGAVSVSWAALAPQESLTVIEFESLGSDMAITLGALTDRDIAGIELRFRRLARDTTTPIAAIASEADWSAAPLLETRPITLGVAGQNIIVYAPVPETGRYRVYGRSVNRQGLRGPISEIGERLFVLPAGNAGLYAAAPQWEGTLTDTGGLPDTANESILVYDPGDIHATRMTKGRLNGQDGWPFGGERTGQTPSYVTPIIDLGKTANWQVRVREEIVQPPNPAPPLPQASGAVNSTHTLRLRSGPARVPALYSAYDSSLLRVNPSTGAKALVGAVGALGRRVEALSAIGDTMYGIGRDSQNRFFSLAVNLTDGTARTLVPLNRTTPTGLVFSLDIRALATADNELHFILSQQVVRVDPLSGSEDEVTVTGLPAGRHFSAAGTGSVIYSALRLSTRWPDNAFQYDLYATDVSAGTSTRIGTLPQVTRFPTGMSWVEGRLLLINFQGQLFSISITDATATAIGTPSLPAALSGGGCRSLGVVEGLANTATVLPGAQTILPATRYVQLEVELADVWLGSGFSRLDIDWEERL